MTLQILPIAEEDIPFVCEVRNDPDTINCLHNNTIFTLEQCYEWYRNTKPAWFIIWRDNIRVGYFRTSDWVDYGVMIGADIHPAFRRQKIAFEAYKQFIEMLRGRGYIRIWLEVLSNNIPAISLYRKLGFEIEGRKCNAIIRDSKFLDSIIMAHEEPRRSRRRCVKIITTYFGDRRRPPITASYEMLQKIWECETTIDPGIGMDVVIVNNEPYENDTVTDWNEVKRCKELINSWDGKRVRRGECHVLHRENVGFSFGAYNFAFNKFKNDYDYFCFIEDDHMIVRDDYFGIAIQQLEEDKNLGFVGLVEVRRPRKAQKPGFVAGGVGFTRTRILQQAVDLEGCLPHFRERQTKVNDGGYRAQKKNGEYRFAGVIWEMGYRLDYINMEQCCVCWGAKILRTSRMTFFPTNQTESS